MIRIIDPFEIYLFWEVAKPQLDKAFEECLYDDADLHYENLVTGKEQLWQIGNNTWAITRIVDSKIGRVFHHVAFGGNNIENSIHEFVLMTEELARMTECKKVFVVGRKGWMKYLPDYKLTKVTLEKEL